MAIETGDSELALCGAFGEQAVSETAATVIAAASMIFFFGTISSGVVDGDHSSRNLVKRFT